MDDSTVVEIEDVVVFAMVLVDSRIHVKVYANLIVHTKGVQD